MAKRFTFRFETMLKLRRQREDQHRRVVAERMRQIAQTRGEIDGIDRQIQEETDAMRTAQGPGTIDIQQTVRHRHWLGHLHRTSLEVQAQLRFLEARLAQERAVLSEASKQRKILEKLRERQHDRHVSDAQRAETQELDELGTVRYVFDRRGVDQNR